MRKSIFAKCGTYQLLALCLSAGVRLLSTGPSSATQGGPAAGRERQESLQVICSLESLLPFAYSGKVGAGCTAIWGRGVPPFRAAELKLSSCGPLAKAARQGFCSPPAPSGFTGDKTPSELIKVNHD